MRKRTVKLHGRHCEIGKASTSGSPSVTILARRSERKPRAKAPRSSAGEKQHQRWGQLKGLAANSRPNTLPRSGNESRFKNGGLSRAGLPRPSVATTAGVMAPRPTATGWGTFGAACATSEQDPFGRRH
jgi:hypothetical protein